MLAKEISIPTQSENGALPEGIKLISEFFEFVRFYTTPRRFRKFKTHQEFAKAFGVSVDTLTDWKKRPIFWKEVGREMRAHEEESRPEILQILRQLALDGDLKAISLWLKTHQFPDGGEST